jgi:thiamine pyrophosphate-dependent acetolactate synthase large subunit-like protein
LNFPNTHYLSRPESVISQADVIIGLELADYWNTVNRFTDNNAQGVGSVSSRIKPGTKLISISTLQLLTKSNYQEFQRFQSVDVPIAGDVEATLPALIDAVKVALPDNRKDAIAKRGQAVKEAHMKGRDETKQLAAMPRSRTWTGRWCHRQATSATGRSGCGPWTNTTTTLETLAAMASAGVHRRRLAGRSPTATRVDSRSRSKATAT